MFSREAPGWRIGTAAFPAGNGAWQIAASLFHGNTIVGDGWCGRDMTAGNGGGGVNAANIGDQG